jgi:hypothetical protein
MSELVFANAFGIWGGDNAAIVEDRFQYLGSGIIGFNGQT